MEQYVDVIQNLTPEQLAHLKTLSQQEGMIEI